MTFREAQSVSAAIQQDDRMCRVTGIIHQAGAYSVTVTDLRTGYKFRVRNREDWSDRVRAASIYE